MPPTQSRDRASLLSVDGKQDYGQGGLLDRLGEEWGALVGCIVSPQIYDHLEPQNATVFGSRVHCGFRALASKRDSKYVLF